MTSTQQHIIRKKTLKVNTNISDALALQRKISNLVNEQLIPRMSDMFDTLIDGHVWLIIERLDIQLENILEDELDTNFTDLLVKKIEAQIKHKRDQVITGALKEANPAITISINEKALQAFLFFIENGMLPWWYEVSSHTDFENHIKQALTNIYTLTLSKSIIYYSQEFKKMLVLENATKRLTGQFSEEVFEAVLDFMFQPDIVSDKTSLRTILKELTVVINTRTDGKHALKILSDTKSLLLQNIAHSQINEHLFSNWLSNIITRLTAQYLTLVADAILTNKELEKYIPQKIKHNYYDLKVTYKKSLSDLADEKTVNATELRFNLKRELDSLGGVMVKNAGLVIVTPYLPQLFTVCGILEDNTIKDVDKAIAILHFIVWGNLEYREYDTVLNKVICNADESIHINLVDQITPEDKDKVNEFLQSIIVHWKVLKNTSIDGFRESFLQRNGKLTYKYDNWFLQVEQNAIDILLQSLPWTIGFIKLPWMKTMLKTEWN